MDKMEALVLRLEAAVAALEKQSGKAPADDASGVPDLPAYDHLLAQMDTVLQLSREEVTTPALAKHLPNNTLEGASRVIEFNFKAMLVIMRSRLLLAKPSLEEWQAVYKSVDKASSKQINGLDKAFRHTQLEKTLMEVAKYFIWMFNTSPFDYLKGQEESADFFYLKVRLLKDTPLNNWFSSIRKLMDLTKAYLLEHFSTGFHFSKKETHPAYSYQQLLLDVLSPSALCSLNATLQDKKQEKEEEKKEKKEEKKEEKKVVKKERKPSKALVNHRWFVENYKDCAVEFQEGELQMTHSIFLVNCERAQLSFQQKINGVTLEKCKDMRVCFEQLISDLTTISCDKVDIQAGQQVPLINLDKTENVQIFLPKGAPTEIVTSMSNTITVQFQNEDKNFDDAMQICTQQTSRLNPVTGQLETTNYETFS